MGCSDGSYGGSNKVYPENYLDHMIKIHLGIMMLFWIYLKIVCLMGQHWESHLDLLTDLSLNMMKTSNLALLMVN